MDHWFRCMIGQWNEYIRFITITVYKFESHNKSSQDTIEIRIVAGQQVIIFSK